MFTGFASENTPAIQVWDFFRTFASTSAIRSVSLADDCAPIQYFRTGATTTSISLYLPTAPIEGKQIKLINAKYGAQNQSIYIYAPDSNGNGTATTIYTLGAGQTLDLCYSKNFISFGAFSGNAASGWVSLNQSPAAAQNSSAVAFGFTNSAIGSNSFVAGGTVNTASADSSTVVGGNGSVATGPYSTVLGGASCAASASYASVLGGTSNTASGNYSAVLGGTASAANGHASIVVGAYRGTARSIIGNTLFPASQSPIATTVGCTQTGLLVLGRQTTDATATVLASDSAAAGTTNQVILPNNSAYYFKGSIVAGVTGAGNASAWSFEGLIERGANAASTAIVGTPVLNLVAQDAGASTWTVALAADTTNGGLAVTVTGQAATTIRWVCKVETTEMTY